MIVSPELVLLIRLSSRKAEAVQRLQGGSPQEARGPAWPRLPPARIRRASDGSPGSASPRSTSPAATHTPSVPPSVIPSWCSSMACRPARRADRCGCTIVGGCCKEYRRGEVGGVRPVHPALPKRSPAAPLNRYAMHHSAPAIDPGGCHDRGLYARSRFCNSVEP